MKNAKEFTSLVSLDPRQVEVLIELIQKDAYNSAIDDAVKVARATIENEWSGNTGSEYCSEYAVIDKNSILKLKKK